MIVHLVVEQETAAVLEGPVAHQEVWGGCAAGAAPAAVVQEVE